MSSTIALQELFKAGFDDFVVPVYETAPFTTIQNRAQVTRSLKAIAGIERVTVKSINRLQNEFGPNGEQVWEADNKDSRVRFVGSWGSVVNTSGPRIETNTVGDYLEITFYGTGLNILTGFNAVALDHRVTVDGGSESANYNTVSTNSSNILNGRNYGTNQVLTVVSNLSLGLHTAKIRLVSGTYLNAYGFEILNQRTDLAVYAGAGISNGSFNGLSTLATSAFNDGVIGSRGARIVKYIENGALKSAVQETDSTAAYLTSASHVNEEIVRRINWREFGANRADDFSTYTTGLSDRAFTLDDGTTTLVADNLLTTNNGAVTPDNTASFMSLTFIGTGIDLDVEAMGAGTTTFSIDGSSVGSTTTAFSTRRIIKVASGLAYGTHVLKIVTSTASPYFPIHDFIIYQPKKPSIPTGTLEVADYNLMTTYSVNTVAGTDTIASGILRKQNTRELVYTGSFSVVSDLGSASGFNINSATAGNKIIHYFFGTGLEIRPGGSAANTFTISINGSTNLSSLTTSVYGANIALTAATGTVVQSVAAQSGQGIAIRGLALGFYTIELTKVSGAGGMSATFDIITPVHISDSTLKIGNQSLKSIAKYSPEKPQSNTGPDLSKAKAWIVFDGANQEIQKSHNISALLRNTTGQYTIYFEKPFKNEFYTCSYQGATSQGIITLAGTPGSGNPEGKKNNRFTFTTTNTTGGVSEASSNTSLVFFGELIDE